MRIKSVCSLSLAGILWMSAGVADAQDYASIQRKDSALGHYARARTMLVEALAEFEQARKIARPDMLIDPEEWRISVISRTEELNRILDPKPRVTREGVRFQANPLLIRRERDRTPRPEEVAKDNSYQGEEDRRNQRKVARAAMSYGTDDKVQIEKPATETTKTISPAESMIREEIKRDAEKATATNTAVPVIPAPETTTQRVIESEEVISGSAAKQLAAPEAPKANTEKLNAENSGNTVQNGAVDEDAVSKVVDEIVKERLNAGAAGTR